MKGGQTGNLTCLGTGTLLIMALIEILLVSKLFKPNQMISRDIYSHHSLENIAASNNANCLETYANLTIIALIDTRDHPTVLLINRPYRGFQHCLDGLAKRSEITVFVWESDGKQLFQNRILQNL